MSFDEKVQITSTNISWHNASVSTERRQRRNGHQGAIIWFTGLSGSGKSTLAHAVEEILFQNGCQTFVLDGDNVRHGLCRDLAFSAKERQENIRRVGEVSKLFVESGTIVLTAFISPYRADRDIVRNMAAMNEFIEVYCNAELEICESRDVKGLYRKARRGDIPEFTGISSPYEAPIDPEVTVNSGTTSLTECVDLIMKAIVNRGICSQYFLQESSAEKNPNQSGGM